MKKCRSISAVFAITALLTACSNNENEPSAFENRNPLKITANIPRSRAVNNDWQQNDAIGLVLFDAGTTNPCDGKVNYCYVTADGSGTFNAKDDASKAYLPTGGKSTDLLAYYPQTSAVTPNNLIVPVDVTTQTNLPAIDLMVADKVTGLTAQNSTASLSFSHKLCKLVLKVQKDDSSADVDLSNATAVIKGTKTKASWNLANAELSQSGDAADIALSMTPDGTQSTAIVLPTDAGSGVSITLTTKNGSAFTASLDPSLALVAGTVNTYTMTLHRYSAAITATITPWQTGVETGGTSTLDVVSGGNVVLPADTEGQFYVYTVDGANLGLYNWNKTTLSATTPIYWEQLSEAAHTFGATFVPTVPVVAGSNFEKDYLISTANNVSFGGMVKFEMKHAMADFAIMLTSKNAEGDVTTSNLFTEAELKAATVTFVSSMESKFDSNKGSLSFVASVPVRTITLPLNDASLIKFRCMIAPQTITSLVITLGGKTYTFKKDLELKAGNTNTLTLNILKSTTGLDVTLAGWSNTELGNASVGIDD
jgi:hypothetical protein